MLKKQHQRKPCQHKLHLAFQHKEGIIIILFRNTALVCRRRKNHDCPISAQKYQHNQHHIVIPDNNGLFSFVQNYFLPSVNPFKVCQNFWNCLISSVPIHESGILTTFFSSEETRKTKLFIC